MLFSGSKKPHNCSFRWGGSRPSNAWFLDLPDPSQRPNGISISRFAGLTNVTNRHTDHATPSVAIGRILCTKCMRCGYNYSDTLRKSIAILLAIMNTESIAILFSYIKSVFYPSRPNKAAVLWSQMSVRPPVRPQ